MFTEVNARRFVDKVRRLKLGEGDAQALMEYFDKMQRETPDFFYSCNLDKEGRLINVFWADGRSRAAFKEFGQVISFDTTYLTNKYHMPFAMFVTGNHHQQTLMLAAVLLADETVPNYLWAFQKFKDCMLGEAPEAIITDQCPAIGKAIKIEFPNTRHRLCLWHIMNKFPTKLGPVANQNGSLGVLSDVVYDSLSPAEFEHIWANAIKDCNLTNNEWLLEMFNMRDKWIPAFVKNSFWAGMSTTQRSESMNAFFDGFVNSKTSLKVFFTRVDDALKEKRDKESYEDYCSMSTTPEPITSTPYEIQASKCYTRTILKAFRQETITLANCFVNRIKNNENLVVMEVMAFGSNRAHKVDVNLTDATVHCECNLFEFKGYLCAHALCALRHLQIMVIPDKYLIKRWRKDCKRSYMYVALSNGPIYRDISTYNDLFRKSYTYMLEIVEVASCNQDAAKEVIQGFEKMKIATCGSCQLKDSALFTSEGILGTNNQKKSVRDRTTCTKTPSVQQVRNATRSIQTYAKAPVSASTKRTAAIEIQNGKVSNQNDPGTTTEKVVPLNPPCSPRSGRPPLLRKKRGDGVKKQRMSIIKKLQSHPNMEIFRAWNQPPGPQFTSTMDLLRQVEMTAQIQTQFNAADKA